MAEKFKWTDELVEDLLKCIGEFKTSMEFNGKDFNADKPRQYEEVRKLMVKLNKDYNIFFGPVEIPIIPSDESDEDTIKLLESERKIGGEKIKFGYKRILEKIKKIRQGFSNAVTSGRRSGSGKVVLEHYDTLTNLFAGSASVEPLNFGLDSSSSVDIVDTEDLVENEEFLVSEDARITASAPLNNKRKLIPNEDNIVPKLIDNKRKHLEKKLSQVKRDEILFKEAKEEGMFRKEMCEAIKESNKMFSDAISNMSESFKLMAESMKISMQHMTSVQPQPSMPYQIPQGSFHQYQQPSANLYPVQQRTVLQHDTSTQQQQYATERNETFLSMLRK